MFDLNFVRFGNTSNKTSFLQSSWPLVLVIGEYKPRKLESDDPVPRQKVINIAVLPNIKYLYSKDTIL